MIPQNPAAVAGWTIELRNATTNNIITTTTTDSDGYYIFQGLTGPYSYKITEVLKSGYVQTFPAPSWVKNTYLGSHRINVSTVDSNFEANFGNALDPGEFPYCAWTCGSNEVKWLNAYITDALGNPIGYCTGTVTPKLYAYVQVTNVAYQIYYYYDLYIDGVFISHEEGCIDSLTVIGSYPKFIEDLPTINCGSKSGAQGIDANLDSDRTYMFMHYPSISSPHLRVWELQA